MSGEFDPNVRGNGAKFARALMATGKNSSPTTTTMLWGKFKHLHPKDANSTSAPKKAEKAAPAPKKAATKRTIDDIMKEIISKFISRLSSGGFSNSHTKWQSPVAIDKYGKVGYEVDVRDWGKYELNDYDEKVLTKQASEFVKKVKAELSSTYKHVDFMFQTGEKDYCVINATVDKNNIDKVVDLYG